MTKRWIATFRKGTLISKQVEATLVPGIPGIFLNEFPGKQGKWVITHRGTGLRLGDYLFSSRKAAKTVAIKLTESMNIDWTVTNTELLSTHPDMEKRMAKIIKSNKISVERGPV